MGQMDGLVISVIVPVYNCEKYLKECVDSIVNQSYKNLDIILINDGSRDGSADIIREHYCTDPRITFVDKENEGVSATRNLGISMAKGEFITFVDGDDYISQTFLKEALDFVYKYDLDVVLGGTQKFFETGRKDYAAKCEGDVII